jgi:hypothetical protein
MTSDFENFENFENLKQIWIELSRPYFGYVFRNTYTKIFIFTAVKKSILTQ